MNNRQRLERLELLESKGVVFAKGSKGVFVKRFASEKNGVSKKLIEQAVGIVAILNEEEQKKKTAVGVEFGVAGDTAMVKDVRTSKGNDWDSINAGKLARGEASVYSYGDPKDAAEAANIYLAGQAVADSMTHQIQKDPTRLSPEDQKKRNAACKFGRHSKDSWDLVAGSSEEIANGQFYMQGDDGLHKGVMTMKNGSLTPLSGNLTESITNAEINKIRCAARSVMQWCANLDAFDSYPGEDGSYVVEWDNMNPLYIQNASDEFRSLEKDGIYFDQDRSDSGTFYGRKFIFYKMEESKINESAASERDIDLQEIAIHLLTIGYEGGQQFSSDDFTAKEIEADYDVTAEEAKTVLNYLDDEELHSFAKEKAGTKDSHGLKYHESKKKGLSTKARLAQMNEGNISGPYWTEDGDSFEESNTDLESWIKKNISDDEFEDFNGFCKREFGLDFSEEYPDSIWPIWELDDLKRAWLEKDEFMINAVKQSLRL